MNVKSRLKSVLGDFSPGFFYIPCAAVLLQSRPQGMCYGASCILSILKVRSLHVWIKGIKSYCNQERQNKKGWEDVTLGNSRAERSDTCRES